MHLDLSLRGCLLFNTQLGISPLLFYEDHIPKRERFSQPPLQNEEAHANPQRPRLCVLHRESTGFGFNLGCVQNKPWAFISQVLLLDFILYVIFD